MRVSNNNNMCLCHCKKDWKVSDTLVNPKGMTNNSWWYPGIDLWIPCSLVQAWWYPRWKSIIEGYTARWGSSIHSLTLGNLNIMIYSMTLSGGLPGGNTQTVHSSPGVLYHGPYSTKAPQWSQRLSIHDYPRSLVSWGKNKTPQILSQHSHHDLDQ